MIAQLKKQQEAVIERRRKLAKLRLAGVQDRQSMLEVLRVSRGTLARDMRALDEQFRREALQATMTDKAVQKLRLERMLQAVWPLAEKGDPKAIDSAVKILEREAKLLGLDAPTRLDHRFDGMTDDQLETYLFGTLQILEADGRE